MAEPSSWSFTKPNKPWRMFTGSNGLSNVGEDLYNIGGDLLNRAGDAYIDSKFRPTTDPAVQPAVPPASQNQAINQATQGPWAVAGVEINKTALLIAGAAVLVAVLLVMVRR